jgi:hypothetical protein
VRLCGANDPMAADLNQASKVIEVRDFPTSASP